MAVQTSAPSGGPAGAATGVATTARGLSAGRIWGELRRLPIIPLFVLIFLLIIPAIFADVLSPHDSTIGDLDRALEPPGWAQDRETSQVVVQRVRDKNPNEISISNARRNLNNGVATLVDANGNGEVDLGETVVRIEEGGSWEYPFGTDKQGRDVLSRMMHGARISLAVSCLAILLGGILGTGLGMVAAYRGGLLDAILMRIVDIKLAFPSILLALTLVVAIGSGFSTVIIVIALLLWARYARVIRGEALAIRERDFIDRARVAGASNLRIMMKHIFPNVFNTVIVLATLEVGHVIILEATLSFLGAGIPRPNPAWGLMAADGREVITSSYWIFMFPCLAIVLTVLSMNLLGDWLRGSVGSQAEECVSLRRLTTSNAQHVIISPTRRPNQCRGERCHDRCTNCHGYHPRGQQPQDLHLHTGGHRQGGRRDLLRSEEGRDAWYRG